MRSLAVLILAAAAFAGFLIHGHFRAAALRSGEANALDQMLRLAERPGREPSESGGYRFRWERGEGGVRWFATPDGVAVYEYDTALFMARGGPEVASLRLYLALTRKQREDAPFPSGWRLLE